MSRKRISRHRQTVGPNNFRVTETYEVPTSELDSHVSQLEGSIAAGYSGDDAPVCMDIQDDKDFFVNPADTSVDGLSRIICNYRTLTWQDWLFRNHNKAIVFESPIQTAFPREEDLDGLKFEGWQAHDLSTEPVPQPFPPMGTFDPTGGASYWTPPTAEDWADFLAAVAAYRDSLATRWRIKDGENFNIRPKTGVVVRAVVDSKSVYIDPFRAKINSVNTGALNNIAASPAQYLLFMGMSADPVFGNQDLWSVGYHFIRHNIGWNSQCIVAEWFHDRIERRLNLDPTSGNFISFGVRAYTDIEAWTGTEFSARLFPATSFNLLDQMVGA